MSACGDPEDILSKSREVSSASRDWLLVGYSLLIQDERNEKQVSARSMASIRRTLQTPDPSMEAGPTILRRGFLHAFRRVFRILHKASIAVAENGTAFVLPNR